MSSTLGRDALDGLFDALARRGYTVVGPKVRDGAIVYDEVRSGAALPAGWPDGQAGGHSRLRRRDDAALFGYAVGPHSWKGRRRPAETRLYRARLGDDGGLIELEQPDEPARRIAF